MAGGEAAAGKKDLEAGVVVVGGGIAGLATALALRRAGVGVARGGGGGVLVLERHRRRDHRLPQRLVRAPRARRRPQAHLPLRLLHDVRELTL